jgi:hypothetical protein
MLPDVPSSPTLLSLDVVLLLLETRHIFFDNVAKHQPIISSEIIIMQVSVSGFFQ